MAPLYAAIKGVIRAPYACKKMPPSDFVLVFSRRGSSVRSQKRDSNMRSLYFLHQNLPSRRALSLSAALVFAVACASGSEDKGGNPGIADTGPEVLDAGHDAGIADAGHDSGAPGVDAGHRPRTDRCGNGLDDDADGVIDQDCNCTPRAIQTCYNGPAGTLGRGLCVRGHQECEGSGEFGSWGTCVDAVLPVDEVCDDTLDNNCNGEADEDCPVTVNVDLDGDCVTAACPPEAPYPVGCNITMSGNDMRGCVASTPSDPYVYFQEGDRCGAGHVTGTISCSNHMGAPLDATSCMINKPNALYRENRAGCPGT